MLRDSRLPERFWNKVDHINGQPCWLWTGSLHESGYGQFWYGGSSRRVHRIVYSVLMGELVDGMVIDHICKIRKCVNPLHLRQVTQSENSLGTVDYSTRRPARRFPRSKTNKEAIMKRVRKEETGCWSWIGAVKESGYGTWKDRPAHVQSYLEFVGDINSGMVIDHLCRNRICVNPEHLEQVSQKENIARALKNQKTCKKGVHDWSTENIGVKEINGDKFCIPCRDEWFAKKRKCEKCGKLYRNGYYATHRKRC